MPRNANLLQVQCKFGTDSVQTRYRFGTDSVQIRLSMGFYGDEPNLLRVNIEFVEEKIRGRQKEATKTYYGFAGKTMQQ